MSPSVELFLTSMLAASLTLAGLAGLISLFRNGEDLTREDILLFRSLILFCLLIAIGSLLPILMFGTSVISSDRIWRACSLIYSIVLSVVTLEYVIQIIKKQTQILFKWLTYISIFITLIFIVTTFINFFDDGSQSYFLWGLLWAFIATSLRLYLFLFSITEHRLKT